jgi:type IV pilus assembly protein PilM
MRVPLVYKNTPHFGFDIGSHSVKMVQIQKHGHRKLVKGYGYCYFPAETITDGVIVDPLAMAKAIRPLLANMTYGSITSRRVATGLPAGKVFTRTLQLPHMNSADLTQAIHYEVEQYVPVPVNNLYIDFEIINNVQAKDGKDGYIDVLMVAAPRTIVDSYISLFDELNLEIGAIETSMAAAVRAMMMSKDTFNNSTLIMDIGSVSSDLTIYDQVIPLTGSVPIGGDHYTNTLVKTLGITPEEANELKVKFGIGPSGMQPKIFKALEPHLQTMVKEAKRVQKFYQERSENRRKIEFLILSGGTASMPGLPEYFQKELGLNLTIANPWKDLITKKMQSISKRDAPMYTTAIGLAMRPGND